MGSQLLCRSACAQELHSLKLNLDAHNLCSAFRRARIQFLNAIKNLRTDAKRQQLFANFVATNKIKTEKIKAIEPFFVISTDECSAATAAGWIMQVLHQKSKMCVQFLIFFGVFGFTFQLSLLLSQFFLIYFSSSPYSKTEQRTLNICSFLVCIIFGNFTILYFLEI